MSGQSIVDRLNAAKHTVAGSALGRAVVKATTEEVMGPKRKHLEYLLQCTSEINVSIPQMADLLIERTQNTSWVVAYKSLITIHHLMCYGNERFSQYMASHNSKFILNNFVLTGVQGIDMSSYIRKYAHYLNEKRETYKLMGFDFCKVKRGKDDGMLRTMNAEKLLKTLPILQKQLDALVQFDIQANELTNGVINSCFVLLSKDLIRLFACYNDGIINLLEKFFDMNKKHCKESLEMYKKFLERTESVSLFLKVAESSGMDKSDIPDLAKAPSSLLEALESHVNGIDNKKSTSSVTAAVNPAKSSAAVSSAINSLNSNSAMLSNEEKRRVLEEEAKTLEAFKSSHLKKQTSLSSPTSENLFSSPPPLSNGQATALNGHSNKTSNQDDLFGLDLNNMNPMQNGNQNGNHSSANDDLLMLSGANPFIQNIVNQSYSNNTNVINPFGQPNGNQMMFGQPAYQNNFPTNQMFPNSNQNKLDDLFSGLNFSSNTSTTTTIMQSNVAASEQEMFNAFNSGGDTSTSSTNDAFVSNDSFNNMSETNQTINQSASSFGNDDYITTFTNSNIVPNHSNNLIGIDFSEFDAFGDVLQPNKNGSILNPASTSSKPSNQNGTDLLNSKNGDQKILSTDLESSLASLADNLDINYKNKNFQKNHQWNPNVQQSQIKTGGQNWKATTPVANAPAQAAAPMTSSWNSGLVSSPAGTPPGWNVNPFAAAGGIMQPMAVQQKLNMNPIQANKPAVQSSNPFDLF